MWLDVDGARVAGVFDTGRESDTKVSAVQYVRFPLEPAIHDRVVAGAPLTIVIDHPEYRREARVPEAVRCSLTTDLSDAAASLAALRWVRDG